MRTRRSRRILADQRGVTYMMVMAAIVLMGISLSVVGKLWTVEMKRDREAELLFRGERIKLAIKAYAADFEVKKGTRTTRYPTSLEQLSKPPRQFLQIPYKDPITGKDFELIKVGAEIQGVRSQSKERPLDQVRFKGAKTYSAVLFSAVETAPGAAPPAPPPQPPQ